MNRKKADEILNKLILKQQRKGRLRMAMVSVATGMLLLLVTILVWVDFHYVMSGNGSGDSLGSSYLTINKEVTDNNMGRPETTFFTPAEQEQLSRLKGIEDMAPLTSNRFPVYASLNHAAGFGTELFLEAVPDRFIDKLPEGWHWQADNLQVPLIISRDFLNMYNYGFALSQGLPQLSESSISLISFDLVAGSGINSKTYKARVVGFSDRISSVLAPKSFIDHGNRVYAGNTGTLPSRLVVRVADPSDKGLIHYLDAHNYITNMEKLRWTRLQAVVNIIAVVVGIFSVLIFGMGILVMILFIELTVATARQKIRLLYELGYAPRYLGRFMWRQFLPGIVILLLFIIPAVFAVQWLLYRYLRTASLAVPPVPGWQVWLACVACIGILLFIVKLSVDKAVARI